METLESIYKVKGKEFLNDLFNNEVRIVERINCPILCFSYNDDELKFFKGNGDEISELSQLLNTFYKTGIKYLKSIQDKITSMLSKNYKYYCYYFPTNKTNYIEYSILPKNNLVLCKIQTDDGNILDLVDDLKPVADILSIDYVQPIFHGKLDSNQKDIITNYIETNNTCDKSFSEFIIKLLDKNRQSSLFQYDFNSPIDSFKFIFKKEGSNKEIVASLIDPFLSSLVSKKDKSKYDSSDIIFSDFIGFCSTIDFNTLTVEGKDKDFKYLDIVCQLFNKYIKVKGEQVAKFDTSANKELKESKECFGVDIDSIPNETTKKILKGNKDLCKIFELIVGKLNSDILKKSDLISDYTINVFNNIKNNITNLVSCESIKKYDFQSFKDKALNPQEAINRDQKESIEQDAKKEIDKKEEIIVKSFKDLKKSQEEYNDKIKTETDKTNDSLKSVNNIIDELKKKIESLETKIDDSKKETTDEKNTKPDNKDKK